MRRMGVKRINWPLIWAVVLTGLACALRARAVTGDILGVTIHARGFWAEITVEGVGTGGTYDLGWGANNTVTGGNKLVLNVTSETFDDTGTPTTLARTVYGSVPLRQAWPNDASNDETVSGSDVIIRIALSDYIYDDDVVTVDCGAGLYTQGTASNATTGMAVTNSSARGYAPVISNWSWPGYQRITGATFDLRAVAFHRDAQQARPVRAVKFEATDGTNTVSTIVTAPVIDAGMSADETPIIEYVGTLSTATLNQGAVLTCNYTVYPWIGDVAMTTSGGPAQPTPLPGPQLNLCDKSDVIQQDIALVKEVGGSDVTGTVYTLGTYDEGTALAYATIGKAIADGADTVEIIGAVDWLGSSNSYPAKPGSWITIRKAASVARSGAVIDLGSGDKDPGDLVKFEDLTLTIATNQAFTGIDSMWYHNCDLQSANDTLMQTGTVWYVTHSNVLDWQLDPYLRQNAAPALIRGNDLNGLDNPILPYCFVGNKRTTKYGATTLIDTDTSGMLSPRGAWIMAFNEIYGWDVSASNMIVTGENFVNTDGIAQVQNIFENTREGLKQLMSMNNSAYQTENTIIWHNLYVGERAGGNYLTSSNITRELPSIIGNYWDAYAVKTDTFGDFQPFSGDGRGNWPYVFSVGSDGNVYGNVTAIGPAGFDLEFTGVSSVDTGTSELPSYPAFVGPERWDGITEGASGGGDYHLMGTSPLIGNPTRLVLPYDIEGTARDAGNNATGPYVFGDPIGGGDPAGTLYVRKDGNDANDGLTDNAGGAKLTIQAAVDVATAGTLIRVRAGTYLEDVSFSTAGTSGNEIVLDGGGVATVRRITVANDYVTLQNLTVSGHQAFSGHIQLGNAVDFITIDNVTVDAQHYPYAEGIAMLSPSPPFGSGDATGPANCVIKNCTIENISGQTFLTICGQDNVVQNCVVRNGHEGDFVRLFGERNVIEDCEFYGMIESPDPSVGNHPDFIQTFGSNGHGSRDHIIRRNIIRDMDIGQLQQLTNEALSSIFGNWTFENNLFLTINKGGGCSLQNMKYYHNLFWKVGSSGNAISFGYRDYTGTPAPASGSLIIGNEYGLSAADAGTIIHNGVTYDAGDNFQAVNANYTAQNGATLYNIVRGRADGCDIRNNIFLDCGTYTTNSNNGWYSLSNTVSYIPEISGQADNNYVAKVNYGNVRLDTTDPKSVAEGGYDNFFWYEPNGINGDGTDPGFLDLPGENFRLKDTSFLIGAGADVSTAEDFDGNPRSATPSIGPFETGLPIPQLLRRIRAASVTVSGGVNIGG